MKTTSMVGALIALTLSATPAMAATLIMPKGANNGSDGLMFDIKVGGASVTFESLSVMLWGKSARNQNFEIYTYDGGIAGHTGNLNGWKLLNTLTVNAPSGEGLRTFDITDFAATADSTTGFYIRTLDRNYSSVMYYDMPGDVVGAVGGANDDISVLSGYGVGKYGNFAGKSLVGSVTYSLNAPAVPEPATWAMMITGFGLAGVAVRRRKSIASLAW